MLFFFGDLLQSPTFQIIFLKMEYLHVAGGAPGSQRLDCDVQKRNHSHVKSDFNHSTKLPHPVGPQSIPLSIPMSSKHAITLHTIYLCPYLYSATARTKTDTLSLLIAINY